MIIHVITKQQNNIWDGCQLYFFVGYDIKIKDKKWAVAVEGYLGAGILGAFAVDNNKDSQLLREIFNKVWKSGKQPQIITSKFVFKVSIYYLV